MVLKCIYNGLITRKEIEEVGGIPLNLCETSTFHYSENSLVISAPILDSGTLVIDCKDNKEAFLKIISLPSNVHDILGTLISKGVRPFTIKVPIKSPWLDYDIIEREMKFDVICTESLD